MTIGELAKRTGLAVRTLRFSADAGVTEDSADAWEWYAKALRAHA